jgi:hypothetical protein
MDESRKRLDKLRWTCMEFPGQIGMDLMKLWRTADRLYTQCDIASIDCRRYQRNTRKYLEAQLEFYNSLEFLEKRITFARLL